MMVTVLLAWLCVCVFSLGQFGQCTECGQTIRGGRTRLQSGATASLQHGRCAL